MPVLVCLRDEAVVTVVEELAVSEADRAAGVVREARVSLGRRACERIEGVRVVWVHSAAAAELRLATNLPVAQAPAQLISVMYRRRWQIEGFFKWSNACWAAGTGWPRAGGASRSNSTWR